LRNYQSILILKPDLDEAQVDQSVEKITAIIDKFGGSVLKLDKWGKKRLAYRVRKNKFGYYLNIYHTCEPGGVPGLEKEYQLYELIIKYLVIRLEESDIERVMSQEPVESDVKEPVESEVKDDEGKEEKSTSESSGDEK
jgi:small subunit ribosomal protein S6